LEEAVPLLAELAVQEVVLLLMLPPLTAEEAVAVVLVILQQVLQAQAQLAAEAVAVGYRLLKEAVAVADMETQVPQELFLEEATVVTEPPPQ
jgi:hypothetical protein